MNPNTSLFKTILDTIIPPRGASLLDVGCGDGAFLRYLHSSRNDLKLTGIDLSENQSQDGVDFIQGDFLETTFTDSFDIVTSLAVIEHVVDIQLFSRRIVQCCRPGGVVVLMTLNDDGLLYRVSRLLHRVGFSAAFNRLYSKHHLNHFSPDSLATLLIGQGLTPLGRSMHNAPLKSIDVPSSSRLETYAMKFATALAFALGSLTGKTYLQTQFFKRG